jgi:hypothetical protein
MSRKISKSRQSLVLNTAVAEIENPATAVTDNEPAPSNFTCNLLQDVKLTWNVGGIKTRNELLEGRNYLVVPMVMLTEGVHTGSNGALYYPRSELAKTPMIWNHKPIVVYHPMMNGQAVSACEPTIISARKVGLIMNTAYESGRGSKPGRLKAEAWLELDRLKSVDSRVLNAIQKGQMVEVSTGLFTDNEQVDGRWGKEPYVAIARNYRADHLAILPDEKGACSIADGAGLMRNAQISHDEIRTQLQSQIKTTKTLANGVLSGDGTSQPWIRDIYGTFCVYSCGDNMYQQGYEMKDGKVSIKGQPQEVTRKQSYTTKDGKVLNTGVPMKKLNQEQIVELLINSADTVFDEGDREWLEAQSLGKVGMIANDAGLVKKDGQDYNTDTSGDDQSDTIKDGAGQVKPKKMGSKSGATKNKGMGGEQGDGDGVIGKDGGKGKEKGRTGKDNADDDGDEPNGKGVRNQAQEPPTMEEYIENAPEGMRDTLVTMMRTHEQAKQKLVKAITANKACRFTEEALAAKDLNELQALYALATNGRLPTPVRNQSYAGLGDVGGGEPAPAEAALELPVINFERRGRTANINAN